MTLSLCALALFAQGPHSSISEHTWLQLLDRVRTIDGSDNNTTHPEWGRAGETFPRFGSIGYEDGVDAPAGSTRPSARLVSNFVCAQENEMPNAAGVSDLVWQWGQFLDHDIDLTPTLVPAEAFDIPVPFGDVWFDPNGTGTQVIGMERSYYEVIDGVREQVNEITSYIDASNVYGSNAVRARALRTLDGTGRMKTSAGDLLPFNEGGLPNAPASSANFFLGGDFRANEQVGLTAMHTLFVREHNYWAEKIAEQFQGDDDGPHHPNGGSGGHGGHPAGSGRTRQGARELNGDQIYQMARCIVAAEMQAITYRQFLPVILGPNALQPYFGYRDDLDAGIANEFATAAYRFGHTMLSPQIQRLGADGEPIADGHLSLANAFFNPGELIQNGIDPLLRGLAGQRAQELDPRLVNEVRNFLFGPPGAGGFDLASLNIQRGRDHGLPSYNQMRRDLGLSGVQSFSEITSDSELQRALRAAYSGDVESVDLWVGGLSEDPLPGALVGEVIQRVLRRQFERLRDGDRFWYQHALPPELVDLVESQDLTRIVRRNTGIGDEFPNDPFHVLPR